MAPLRKRHQKARRHQNIIGLGDWRLVWQKPVHHIRQVAMAASLDPVGYHDIPNLLRKEVIGRQCGNTRLYVTLLLINDVSRMCNNIFSNPLTRKLRANPIAVGYCSKPLFRAERRQEFSLLFPLSIFLQLSLRIELESKFHTPCKSSALSSDCDKT